MLGQSTPNNQSNSSHQHRQNELILDTANINSEDLSQLLQLNAEIEERRLQRHSLAGDGSGLLKATMTRGELFEVSSFEDDRFLTALEHQNSYVAPSRVQVTDLDLSSIENLMKYFDEEVPVTPTKRPISPATPACHGKVATAIANLQCVAKSPTQAAASQTQSKQKINKLKQKFENQASAPVRAAKPAAKLPIRVKQIAQRWNNKISQVMRLGTPQPYSQLHNEYSPESKPVPAATAAPATHYKPVSYRLPGLPSPVPSPRQRRKAQASAKKATHNTCLVAENVFAELSVKDKALLFNKFIGEMSARHPKFNAHADNLKEQVKKEMARGEVVVEPQASVKHLAQELEAKCVLSCSTTSPNASPPPRPSPPKTSRLHVSTLTVQLNPSPCASPTAAAAAASAHTTLPATKPRQPCAPLSTTFPTTCTQKRNLAAIRCALPTEPYAPPKKIRRTRNERCSLENKVFFQNEQLESLFYNWLREENGVLFNITSTSNEEQTIEIAIDETASQSNNTADITQKSAVERLLEEAIAKLEESKAAKESQQVAEKQVDTTVAETQHREEPLVTPSAASTAPATPCRVKRRAPPVPAPRHSLQTQSCSVSSTSSAISSCKQSEAEESESGLSTLPKITTDESQAETQQQHATYDSQTADFEFSKPLRPPRKKKMRRTLTWKKEASIVEATAVTTSTDSDSDCKKSMPASHHYHGKKKAPAVPASAADQSYIELDKSLMQHVNSPRKIKSAYTLTVVSSPSPNAETDQSETPRESLELTQFRNVKREANAFTDSFIDQGFETGSNDHDQSLLRSNAEPLQPAVLDGSNIACFSTPVKASSLQHSQTHAGTGAQQQLFSPIGASATKQQREPRRSSLVMQVIREDQPLDLDAEGNSSSPNTPCSFSASESAFFANAPTIDMPSNLDELSTTGKPPVSMFWISVGVFNISLEIFHSAPDRLRLLYEIFTQKSVETRELCFGIDGHKFASTEEMKMQPMPERPPHVKDCSHYWFANGDLTVPFSGKLMSSEKIQRLFKFIGDELSFGNELRFGVDHIEFSSLPEFWHNTPKFSIESSYSMLVGLQTGHSNGLEGRSKYAWPNNSGTIRTSDLEHSEFESDSFNNSDMFSLDYENVPLDELFQRSSTSTQVEQAASPISQNVKTPQQQQIKLRGGVECPPENVKKLRAVIRAIEHIGQKNGYRSCTMEQLENYMFFLTEYADLCLDNCSEQLDKIIQTLLDRRAVAV